MHTLYTTAQQQLQDIETGHSGTHAWEKCRVGVSANRLQVFQPCPAAAAAGGSQGDIYAIAATVAELNAIYQVGRFCIACCGITWYCFLSGMLYSQHALVLPSQRLQHDSSWQVTVEVSPVSTHTLL
jgi:hypothetical protein